MKRRPRKEEQMFHMILGGPSDDCPICRAHGIEADDFPSDGGMMVVGMAPFLDEMLHCTCPLCSQLKFEKFPDSPPFLRNGGDPSQN